MFKIQSKRKNERKKRKMRNNICNEKEGIKKDKTTKQKQLFLRVNKKKISLSVTPKKKKLKKL